MYIQSVLDNLTKNYPHQPEFLQAASEVFCSIAPLLSKEPYYKQHRILERISEPEKIIKFRIVWERDNGDIEINRGIRVQFNSALGPYKGGLRFESGVNLSTLKFLGFEQAFKNSLTGLMLGGAKGGSDFNPKDKSDREIMRFCQAFIRALSPHIGAHTDIPAGDIGVGEREIGYMFGEYKKISNRFDGSLTGKSPLFGGSFGRKEATGYGAVYFAKAMLEASQMELSGKTCIVSGSGNVAIYAMEKLVSFGAKVIACSDRGGVLIDKNGVDTKLLKKIKEQNREPLHSYTSRAKAEFYPNGVLKISHIPCEYAFFCATQNEVDIIDAKIMINNSVKAVVEGANMPLSNEAANALIAANILYAPSKAANAGGVAVSGLEMGQDALFFQTPPNEVEAKLKQIMQNIFDECATAAAEYNEPKNLKMGANIAGFKRVADAMIKQGL
ncbi:MAG TPA: NADP-specific glutamate dehydrogenase [Campylobacterales bacterium]|nr:NADP-specific glutamate dehydrogenase [Campylobacterales bacterium]